MSTPDPVSAAIAAMEARCQQAYVLLMKHMQICRDCHEHPLCADGRALWNRWKGKL
ncbi:hypothetical protein [Streptomyces sp. NPDC055400]